MPLQFLQQDGPHQVLGWRVETTAIQRYTASQGIVCNLRITLFQDDNTTWMRGRGGAAVHTRRRRHPFAFACAACCKKWFEYSHSPSRRYICHVALLCFPKWHSVSHLSGVWDTVPHAICRHQPTGLVIGRQHLCQPNSATCRDTVIAILGQVSALKLTKRDTTYQETFCQVGQSWGVEPQLLEKVQQFICRMEYIYFVSYISFLFIYLFLHNICIY